MAKLRNRLNQKLIILGEGGKTFDIMAKATLDVSDKQLDSPHIKRLIQSGDLEVMKTAAPAKKADQPKKTSNEKQ